MVFTKGKLFWLLSLTWGLIMTLIGFLFYLINLLTLSTINVKMFKSRIVVRSKIMQGGVSMGLFVFLDTRANDSVLYHEMGHSVQNIVWGVLFLPVIGIPSFVRAALWNKFLSKRKGANYYSIWFERQATEFGERLK